MKHQIKGRKLNRNSAHRKALMRNLSIALISNERIKTTLPKAKELRPFVEKILSVAKNDNLANRRLVISILGNAQIADKLFKDIAPRILKRNGGYTRIMKNGFRVGDKAPMAVMELVDRVEVIVEKKDNLDSKKLEKKAVQNKEKTQE
ncbi:MAG: 50S ribosomal protein L17 [Alphaproteobacteria bacterium]